MNLYSKILGLPFVFKKLRPLLLGFDEKKDFKPIYDLLYAEDDDIVVDIGCGMGNALNYIHTFSEYYGFDTDAEALREFEKNYSDDRVCLYNRCFDAEDAITINPSKICMFGLLHHLDDAEVRILLDSVSRSRSLKRIITCDVFYEDNNMARKMKKLGVGINNLFTKLDRGKFGREIGHYKQLIPECLHIVKEVILPVGYFVKLFVMVIEVKEGLQQNE